MATFRMRFGAIVVAASMTGCVFGDRVIPRKYADVSAMGQHFRRNGSLFRKYAAEWFSSTNPSVCFFGKSVLGLEAYRWGKYWIAPNWLTWDVTHWDGKNHVHESAGTLARTANLAGATSGEVARRIRKMTAIEVDCVSKVRATWDGHAFSYLELEFFPVRHPNGLLYAPEAGSLEAFRRWAKQPPREGTFIVPLEPGWFYYDGHLLSGTIPFTIRLDN